MTLNTKDLMEKARAVVSAHEEFCLAGQVNDGRFNLQTLHDVAGQKSEALGRPEVAQAIIQLLEEREEMKRAIAGLVAGNDAHERREAQDLLTRINGGE